MVRPRPCNVRAAAVLFIYLYIYLFLSNHLFVAGKKQTKIRGLARHHEIGVIRLPDATFAFSHGQ